MIADCRFIEDVMEFRDLCRIFCGEGRDMIRAEI